MNDIPDPHPSNPANAHSEEEQARRNQAALLHEEQQRQLARHRGAVAAQVAAQADPREIVGYQQQHLVNRPQHATWGDFWPMIDGLYQVGPPPDPLIILGGWLRPPPPDLTALLPNPAGLQKDVYDFGVYYPAFHLSGYRSVYGLKQEELFQQFRDWVRRFPEHFDPARRPRDEWDWDAAVEAIPELVPIKRRIEDALTFMDNQALVFHSTPADPGAAWREFWQFSFGYHHLREYLCSAFRDGEYYLLFAKPSAPPAATPAAPPAAVPPAP